MGALRLIDFDRLAYISASAPWGSEHKGALVRWLIALCVGIMMCSPAWPNAEQDRAINISLQSAPLSEALAQLSQLYNVNFLYSSDVVHTKMGDVPAGHYTLEGALTQLLRSSALTFQRVNTRTYSIMGSTPAPEVFDEASPPQSHVWTRGDHEAILVTGTRTRARSQAYALAPIDVISPTLLGLNASEELMDGLAQLLPSFTAFRFPLNDGLIYNRPTGLRGLNPDHTLVLINGHRRHHSAFLEAANGQAADLTHIPILAIKRIEVLRDGASAQYGSDAIAGVINILLNDEPALTMMGQWGQYYQGDGAQWRWAGQTGWRGREDTFLVINGEYFLSAQTSRSRQRLDAIEFARNHPELKIPDRVQNWGQPEREGWRMALNGEHAVTPGIKVYGFGTLSLTRGVSDFNWRNPDTTQAFAPNPAFPDFDLRGLYPIGFTPRFGQDEIDYSGVIGARAQTYGGWLWDFSISQAMNRIDYRIDNTFNPSLGPESPQDFKPGRLSQYERIAALDIQSPPISAQSILLAFGLELREDEYQIQAGDAASYLAGPGAIYGAPIGSNGFPGYTPDQAGQFSQTSLALYAEMQGEPTARWRWGAAGRYEDFSLFGQSLTGKFSTAFDLTSELTVRSTLSTGFRAPTPGQVFSERTSQGLVSETLDVQERGRFSAHGRLAQLISARDGSDIEALRPETSRNFTIGLGYRTRGGLTLTADYFDIIVRDRFRLSQNYNLSDQERAQLRDEGLDRLSRTNQITFFQNDYDTRTRGLDVVAEYQRHLFSGQVALSGAYNYLETRVIDSRLPERVVLDTLIEREFPEQRLTLSAIYQQEAWSVFVRTRTYGNWVDTAGVEHVQTFQTFGPRTFVDLGYDRVLSQNISLRIGAENVFNTYPDEAKRNANRGLIYSRSAPYDTDGGQYYVRLSASY